MYIEYSDGTQSIFLPNSAERVNMIVKITGYLSLCGYPYSLPEGLTSIDGDINLYCYEHPLPSGLKHIRGSVIFANYPHPLPDSLETIEGSLYLKGYKQTLPPWILSAGEDCKGRVFYAIYQKGEWQIGVQGRRWTVNDALSLWKHEEYSYILVEELAAQIKQSSLR